MSRYTAEIKKNNFYCIFDQITALLIRHYTSNLTDPKLLNGILSDINVWKARTALLQIFHVSLYIYLKI